MRYDKTKYWKVSARSLSLIAVPETGFPIYSEGLAKGWQNGSVTKTKLATTERWVGGGRGDKGVCPHPIFLPTDGYATLAVCVLAAKTLLTVPAQGGVARNSDARITSLDVPRLDNTTGYAPTKNHCLANVVSGAQEGRPFWTGYQYSSLNWGSDNFRIHEDRKLHGHEPFLLWFSKQMREADRATRVRRTSDVLDVHYSPQGTGIFRIDTRDEGIQPQRITDRQRHRFGELSCAAESAISEQISIFAALEKSSGALTLLLINKMPETMAQAPLTITGWTGSPERIEENRVQQSLQAAITLPPYSLTLLRISSRVLKARAMTGNVSAVNTPMVMGTIQHRGKEQ